MKKILVIRFSSIGDIVLTTPVVRCLATQQKNTEIHFLTKKKFESVVCNNPYIHKLWSFNKSVTEIMSELKAENFDYVIDLHNNLRSTQTKVLLGKKSFAVKKLNLKKWLAVNFKTPMPHNHIVERYLKTIEPLGISNDNKGLDFFVSPADTVNIQSQLNINGAFVAFVIGAQFATKRLPANKIISLCKKIKHPLVLIGGPDEKKTAEEVISSCSQNIISACGKFNLCQSASVVKQAAVVITHDTGLMHIAAAFQKKIISVWGNTIPEFGMTPYYGSSQTMHYNAEVKNLSCRPCSKIGHHACPKKHFRCMNDINESEIAAMVEKFM